MTTVERERLAQHAQATVAADGAADEAQVERVARAIEPSVWSLSDLSERLLDDWHRAGKAKSLRQARAAIAAMKDEVA